jgi:quercetin 2,3-dioxygenase
MIHKIDLSQKRGNSHISILYPGLAAGNTDSGIGSIGRIDQASIPPGVTIRMHPHVNDEILSYFRSGRVMHTDSEGFTEYITPTRLMLMKAGKVFYHEEQMLNTGENMQGLQIFIRPGQKDLKPEVIFKTLNQVHSFNAWRLLASPDSGTELRFSSTTWIYDCTLTDTAPFHLPSMPQPGLTALLYVFRGSIAVNPQLSVRAGESLLIKAEAVSFTSADRAELVLFLTDEEAPSFARGMYSGNQL